MMPDEVLEQLKKGADARKRRNLDLVYEICREQHERGSKDFTLSTIGRLSQQRGGPVAQSFRNKGGGHLRAIISAWANHAGGMLKRPQKTSGTPMDSVLRKIEDAAVRALMGSVIAENTRLKGQVNLLKRNANVIIDMRPEPAPHTIEILPPTTLTESEKEALAHAISDEFMKSEGWTVAPSGRVKNANGRSLYKAGYVTAVKKVLGHSKGEQNGGM
jgi:hypothetical protein